MEALLSEKNQPQVRCPDRVHSGGESAYLLVLLFRIPAPRHRPHLELVVSLEQVFCCLWSHWGPDPNTHLHGRDGVTVQ